MPSQPETQARSLAAQSPAQLNSLTKYPSILTLHALGERGRLTASLTTPALFEQPVIATEKIDGTSARLLVFADGSYLVGSRENLLTVSGDLFFDPAVGIVEGLRRTVFPQLADASGHLPTLAYSVGTAAPAPLTVIYGEFYGGKVTASSKHYALPEQVGFRVFDVAVFADSASLAEQLTADVRELSTWRESETPAGLRYGQPLAPRPPRPATSRCSAGCVSTFPTPKLRCRACARQVTPRGLFSARLTARALSKFVLRTTSAP
jgi:hypothetical protein